MECNKDEATRAKEIAETKFTAKDFAGAKKFALKAQSLYPELDGISQMIATFEVYLSSEKKVNGEADWYAILGTNPMADDETVRKQYRKLALILHPDKNKSIGADGAFKLLSEAWSLLSDKARRSAYDQKRRAKIFQKVSTAAAGCSAPPPSANGFYNFTKRTAPAPKVQKSTTERAAPNSQKPKAGTFWTVCHKCKTQFEYLRVYINHNLLCPNCRVAFFAAEIAPPPVNGTKSSKVWNFSQHHQSSNDRATNDKDAPNAGVGTGPSSNHDSHNNQSFPWVPFSRATGVSTAAQAATMVQQAYEKVKREREEAQAATKKGDAFHKKYVQKKSGGVPSTSHYHAAKRSRGLDDENSGNNPPNVPNQAGVQTGGPSIFYSFAPKQGKFDAGRVGGVNKIQMFREVPQPELQKILMGKAKKEIQGKVYEWTSAEAARKASSEERKGNREVGEEPQKEVGEKSKKRNKTSYEKSFSSVADTNRDAENGETLGIKVPDPDFHDFDKERTENAFGENQVWAAYDGDDGMPRFYAIIHNVVSLDPFKVRLSWLNSKSNSEFGPLNWVASGFPKTCGDFKVGKSEISTSLNSFSHKVKWMKGQRGIIFIFPKKGDIWALYRNWSPDWNKSTADEIIQKYDMVEVLEDYDEERGVAVSPLVKVDGFKTVFRRHSDPKETRKIPREEMFRFSHHVPSHLLTGEEAPNAPEGCWELDPAATSLDLIQPVVKRPRREE